MQRKNLAINTVRICAKAAAALALALGLAILPGCATVSTNDGAERWTPVSPMAHTSPQLAQSQGRVGARCGVTNAAAMLNNATVTEDRGVYRIQRGDKLQVTFYRNSELDRYVLVRPDGRFSIEPYGDVTAAGLTPAQLAQKLDIVFSTDLYDPGATVSVLESPFRQVFVGGQVNYPGMMALRPGMTATQAIISAGWFRDDARADQIVLIRRDACGDPYGTFVQVANAVAHSGGDRAAADHGQDIALLPNDILVVPRSTIGQLDLFVKQYFRDLLPVQPYLSVGPPF
jgi:protein involved in polysaccharide export with SLBB domain